jgi:hypothetical protein
MCGPLAGALGPFSPFFYRDFESFVITVLPALFKAQATLVVLQAQENCCMRYYYRCCSGILKPGVLSALTTVLVVVMPGVCTVAGDSRSIPLGPGF